MLFGPKFYVMLEKLTVWRQSLFALVLATRQYPHFALWCEIHERQGKTEYLEALKKCWEYHPSSVSKNEIFFKKHDIYHELLGSVCSTISPTTSNNLLLRAV